jgi:hypothetical protein
MPIHPCVSCSLLNSLRQLLLLCYSRLLLQVAPDAPSMLSASYDDKCHIVIAHTNVAHEHRVRKPQASTSLPALQEGVGHPGSQCWWRLAVYAVLSSSVMFAYGQHVCQSVLQNGVLSLAMVT